MAEQFVGQMIRTLNPYFIEPSLNYWVREEKTSCAEVDYLIQQGSTLIPIEVKAGKTGTLKSLHLLMGLRGWSLALRFNADYPSLTPVATETALKQSAQYQLLSLPFYLIGQVPRLLQSGRIGPSTALIFAPPFKSDWSWVGWKNFPRALCGSHDT
jgi:hypothetical protein